MFQTISKRVIERTTLLKRNSRAGARKLWSLEYSLVTPALTRSIRYCLLVFYPILVPRELWLFYLRESMYGVSMDISIRVVTRDRAALWHQICARLLYTGFVPPLPLETATRWGKSGGSGGKFFQLIFFASCLIGNWHSWSRSACVHAPRGIDLSPAINCLSWDGFYLKYVQKFKTLIDRYLWF